MKSHLAKVSLALLSAAFLLGCQEQRSELVGPDGLGPEFDKPNSQCTGHCHDEDVPDPGQSTLTLEDGMLQPAAFPVEVSKDTRKTLNFGNHNFAKPDIMMNFQTPGTCEGFAGTNGGAVPVGQDFDDLVAELTVEAAEAKVVIKIDKTSVTPGGGAMAGGHVLLVQYQSTNPNLGTVRIELGGPFDEVDPATVEWTQTVVGDQVVDVFVFTGPVVVWDAGGGINDQSVIQCPGVAPDPNKVVVTLNR